MYILYAEIDDKDVRDYKGILNSREQFDCRNQIELQDSIDFLRYYADRTIKIRVDQIVGDATKAVLSKVVTSSWKMWIGVYVFVL